MRLTLRSRKSYDGCETSTRGAPVDVRKVNRWRTLGSVRCGRLPHRSQQRNKSGCKTRYGVRHARGRLA